MDAEQLTRVRKAAWAFGQLLEHIGTATCPSREDPPAIAAYGAIIDDAYHHGEAARQASKT